MSTLDWLLQSSEPWTAYRTLLDLVGTPADDSRVQEAHQQSLVRQDLLAHPAIQAMIQSSAEWGAAPLTRHNDSSHPIYALSVLADFGLHASDPGMQDWVDAVLSHQSPQGAFLSPLKIPAVYGGDDALAWNWIACDSPTLLYALQSLGLANDERVLAAAAHLARLVQENGWHCTAAPQIGKFRGPGRKADPCPIANLLALKALARLPGYASSPAVQTGCAMLLTHWEHRKETKYYLFGMGTDFCKLKYPYVWYDILHVVDVLSLFPHVHNDSRFREMLAVITSQADEAGRYTATSMYKSWQGWSFADKKHPSPWLTFLVLSIQRRIENS
jgi:hypothetical protein